MTKLLKRAGLRKYLDATTKRLGSVSTSTQFDIVFGIDGTKSVNSSDYKCTLNMVKELTKLINAVQPINKNGTRVGIIKFSSEPIISLKLYEGNNLEKVLSALADSTAPVPGVRTDRVINVARRMLKGGGRQKAMKLMFIITNGNSKINPKKSADFARSDISN
ncbi:unnamed protein product [Gordionus sp. m RMFG-2023]